MTNRLDQVRTLLVERGLDAALITSPANRFYLSGYTMDGVAASAGIVTMIRTLRSRLGGPSSWSVC